MYPNQKPSFYYRLAERLFHLKAHGSSVKVEILAGMTTFVTMCYVIFVIPSILSEAGMDKQAVFTATCIVAGLSSIVVGLYANWPVGLAPGMGLNAFFAYAVVQGIGYSWQEAMGAVFWGGVGFMVLSLFKVRGWIVDSIPDGLKVGITSGIGLFLALIGLKTAGIVIPNPSTIVSLGDITQFEAIMASLSLFLIIGLAFRGINSAVLIAIGVVTVIALLANKVQFSGVFLPPPSMKPIFAELDIWNALSPKMFGVIIAFMFVNLFDTTGTLIAVGYQAKLVDKNGKIVNMNRAMITDSGASWLGAICGVPTVTSYVESAAGAAAGGRTGLTAVTIGVLFLLCSFLSPIAAIVPSYATAGALVYVAVLMVSGLTRVDWEDLTEAVPVLITAIMMPLSFSIANGIALGLIAYPIIKVLSGKYKDVSISVWALACLFILKFVFFGI